MINSLSLNSIAFKGRVFEFIGGDTKIAGSERDTTKDEDVAELKRIAAITSDQITDIISSDNTDEHVGAFMLKKGILLSPQQIVGFNAIIPDVDPVNRQKAIQVYKYKGPLKQRGERLTITINDETLTDHKALFNRAWANVMTLTRN